MCRCKARACAVLEVVGREEDVSSVEEGRLLGRREVGNLAMLDGSWPGPVIGEACSVYLFNF